MLHNEVQALWSALATSPHGGNIQLVLDFIISLSLERREQNFVDHAKQIVVYLSATLKDARVIDFLLLQLVPKNMVNEKKAIEPVVPAMIGLPYAADLAAVLPIGNKQVSQDLIIVRTLSLTYMQTGLSLGQIALIFLVDLIVAGASLTTENAIRLIQTCLILWDHYSITVQEHAREMLIHLVHELITSKVGAEVLSPRKQQIEKLVETIRGNEPGVTWGYEDNNGKEG